MARLFFALWPDDDTRCRILDVAQQFNHDDLRPVKKSNLHMTLEFLGETSDEDKQGLIDKVGDINIQSFDIELTRIGFWKQPQILYVGTRQVPEPLIELVRDTRKHVKRQGLKPDTREYRPHVTIARKAKQLVVPGKTFLINWFVDQFALVISEPGENGVQYRVLDSWQLS